jgi:hypothetical protein
LLEILIVGVYFLLMRRAIDDFPFVSVSRLRALGAIRGTDESATVTFPDGLSFVVGLFHRRFPNGGSWSFFVCPCGRRARRLRLYEGGELACRGCLKARGLRHRVELFSHASKRAAYTAPRWLARLHSSSPARLHPRPGRMLDRRVNMEIALQRSLLVARQRYLRDVHKLGGKR